MLDKKLKYNWMLLKVRWGLKPSSAHAGGGNDGGLDWAVSPTELREALSSLNRAAVNFELSEMHDAWEARTRSRSPHAALQLTRTCACA